MVRSGALRRRAPRARHDLGRVLVCFAHLGGTPDGATSQLVSLPEPHRVFQVYEEREPLSDWDTAEDPLPTGRIVATRPLTPAMRPGRMTSWVYDALWESLQQAWARRSEDRPGLEKFAPVLGWLAQRAG
jgi:hypothetical protein